ncbi:hypothetical protein GCM10010981_37480 [Dyella nitratireducens]|uniref:Uncharacterized protein n=1 Tax=Dyella nitratireducens TaxID=1849580 RepID=A0ABQ1GJ97_9GAMM|nr:hypothetical protein GCM10010981_37480 [Dyella nitratireducens]GLQ41250.1 hypothetical protein GCM10007902_11000 [Dyella nitratireducens]
MEGARKRTGLLAGSSCQPMECQKQYSALIKAQPMLLDVAAVMRLRAGWEATRYSVELA